MDYADFTSYDQWSQLESLKLDPQSIELDESMDPQVSVVHENDGVRLDASAAHW
jgi:hypothetical protein